MFGRGQPRGRVLLQTISRPCDLARNSCAIYHQQRFSDRVTAPLLLLPPFIERKPRKETARANREKESDSDRGSVRERERERKREKENRMEQRMESLVPGL